MFDDSTLLRRYATEGDEEAFAEFVRRQLPLVYSAALRRLGGDTHAAEDVAQVVFCAVALDATKLSQHGSLTGWLYTATRNAVIDVIRAEKRRRGREKEAQIMQETLFDTETPADWSRLSPVLDAAMDELSGSDRDAVLLRFFQGRAFAEIGSGLGLSEDAARKRVDRALDKLGSTLRRHGIGSTSAALATLLAGGTVSAAPASLAASITGAALATGAATAGAVALVTVTKLQIGIAAVVIAGGAVGLISQQRTITALREDTVVTQQQMAKLTTENSALAQARIVADADRARLRAELGANPKAEVFANRRVEATGIVAPRPVAGAILIGPLPDTADTRNQKAHWHRRLDSFFRQRGLTSAQGDRIVELKVHQGIEWADFQAAVTAANLRGDSRAVQSLRAKDVSPITQELLAILGPEGYEAFGKHEASSVYLLNYVEPMLPAFVAANVPLSPQQADEMLQVFAASSRHVQAKPTDIGTTNIMDWDAVVAQASGILAPAQLATLQIYAGRRKSEQRSP